LRELLQAEETKKWHAPEARQHRSQRHGKQGFFAEKTGPAAHSLKKEVKSGRSTLFSSKQGAKYPFFIKKRANSKTPLTKKSPMV